MIIKNLPGDKDEDDLFKLFFSLRFEVKIHRNLTADEMVHKLESYSKRQHKGAFFLIILSHGTMGKGGEAIVGTDGKTVMMNDIESFFHATKCPSLHEVPKIFLIDACLDEQQEIVYFEPQSHDTSRLVPESAISHNKRVAKLDTSDFLLVYASTHGHVAYSTSRGSRLTRTFTEVTKEAADDKTITKIIQEVKARVEEHGQQTVELVDTLTHDYFMKRYVALHLQLYFILTVFLVLYTCRNQMRGLEEIHSKFCTKVEEWISVREKTIQKIECIIDDLKIHHRNVNISRVTGSGVSIAGSLIAIVGFGLAPVTLGASIGLTVGGIVLAVAGGSTVAGASIADTVLQKLNVKQAQEQLKEDYNQLYMIQVIAKIINSNTVAATGAREESPEVDNNRVIGEVLGQSFLRTSTVGVRTAEMAVSNTVTLEIGASTLRVGGTATKSIAAVGLVLNVVLIPIDLIEIVRSSVSLAKGSQTKAVEKLKEIVEQLQQQLRELKSIVYQETEDQAQEQDQAGRGHF